MAKVYDRQGQLVEVPDDEVSSGIQAGQYGLDPGFQYRVVWQDGAEETLAAERAVAAVQTGRASLRVGTAAAQADARAEAQRAATSRTPAESAAAAALNAVDQTLGGQVNRAAREMFERRVATYERDRADLRERGLSEEEINRALPHPVDDVQEAQARHPVASGLGAAAGLLGPGVAGAADTLAVRLAAAAAGQGTRAGAFGAAARALAGHAGGGEALAGQAVQRFVQGRGASAAVASGVGFAAEGGISGARAYLTQQQATGTPFSAEQLAASVTGGALIGLGAGWAGDLVAGAATRGAARLLRRADRPRPGIFEEAAGVERSAEGRYLIPREPSNPYYAGVVRLQSLATGIDVENLAPLTHRGFRELMNTTDAQLYETARVVARVRDVSRTADDMLSLAQGPRRLEFLRAAAADAAPEAAGVAQTALGRQLAALDGLLAQGEHMLGGSARRTVQRARDAAMAAFEDVGGPAAALRRAADDAEDVGTARTLLPFQAPLPPVSPAHAFGAVDGYASQVAAAVRSAKDPAAAGALQDLHASIRHMLEDPAVWGGAARARVQLDDAVTNLANSNSTLNARLGATVLLEPGETAARGIDAGRVQAWLGTLHDPRADETWETLHRFLDDVDGLDDLMTAQGYDRVPSAAAVRDLGAAVRQRLRDHEPGIVARATLRRLEQEESSRLGQAIGVSGLALGRAAGGAVTGGVLSGATGGDPVTGLGVGAAAGLAYGAMSRPVSFYRSLSALDRLQRGARVRFQGAMSGVRARLTGALSLAASVPRAPTPPLIAALQTASTRQEAYVRMRQEIAELASTPGAVAARVGNAADGFDETIDPTVVPGLGFVATRGMQLLDAVLPPLPEGPWPDLSRHQPSEADYAAAIDLLKGFDDPTSVFEEFARTGRVNFLGARVVEQTYPGMYAAAQQTIMDILTDPDRGPSYQLRLRAGGLINVPTDRSLTPQLLSTFQSRYAQTRSQARAQGFVGPQVRAGGARSIRSARTGTTITESLQYSGPAGSFR